MAGLLVGSNNLSCNRKVPVKTNLPNQAAFAATGTPAPRINVKWRWHYDALRSLRERLSGEIRAVRREASDPIESHSMSAADSATDELDHNLLLGRVSREGDALLEVDDALQRIVNGTYGVCQETGQRISPARLRAVPWTRFSREVEERIESESRHKVCGLGPIGTVRPERNPFIGEAMAANDAPDQPANDESLQELRPERGGSQSTKSAGARRTDLSQ